MNYRKVYVDVVAKHMRDGSIRPVSITFENGRTYPVDRLRQVRRAAATNVGGSGLRYTVMISGNETYLFEDDGRWFVEAKGQV